MKQKAFTLVELLVVIVILGLLALLIVPNVNKLINSSKDKLYISQVKSIEDSAENFITDYYEQISNLSKFTIDLKLLKDLAYVEGNIRNPRTEKYFSDESLITFNKINNRYQATLFPVDSETIMEDTKYLKHIVLLKEGSTYTGNNYKANSNVILLGFNGKIYNNSEYAISSIDEDSILNVDFRTITYTITLTEDNNEYTYTIKRDEKTLN